MGFRYVKYRIRHEVEKRTGKLKKLHPVNPEFKYFINCDTWKSNISSFVVNPKDEISSIKNYSSYGKEFTSKVINGELIYFNYEWKNIGIDYDWITNPESGYKYDINKHWSEIQDLSQDAGDIKYVWEKSRFTFLLTIIRNDFHNDQDNSEYVFNQIEDWIDKNPINKGPNWRCSQEISLRIINWCFALHFYKKSPSLTESRWEKIQNVIYWSLHHVYHHIDFSRIAVRNNHAITETLMLSLSELLFPFIPETKLWSQKGRAWFEQEIDYQIYNDGTFLQFSMNYHRVVIQLLSFGIALSEINNKPFSKNVYDKAYKSLNFLYQCLQEENGFLPNYGSNDGALFFPLSDTNYRDYRAQLNTLHKLLVGEHLYSDRTLTEDSNWFVSKINKSKYDFKKLEKKFGCLSFNDGGYYLLRENSSFTFIRCGNHKDRPAHADNLHVDIWVKGINILRDSGTYKYNTDSETVSYFTGSASHNTVMVGKNSQMLKGSRFIWYYWSQSLGAKWIETQNDFVFEGKISAFRFLNKKAVHQRKIIKSKLDLVWKVEDELMNLNSYPKIQLWNCDNHNLEIESIENGKILDITDKSGLYSDYYGAKEHGNSKIIEFQDKVITTLKYKNEN
ncbi:MAG: heparinase [Flavobacteriales bacterium]|nr:heparinase [Flavobacteriales bacterium]